MATPDHQNDRSKYRKIKDIEEKKDPLEGTPQETPSGPFAPPPMPEVLHAREGDEPRRNVVVKPVNALHLGKVFAVGMDFAYAFIGATALGWLADWFFKSSPKGLIIGACIGLVVGMYRFITESRLILRTGTPKSGAGRGGDSVG